jgi:hypothetical protein
MFGVWGGVGTRGRRLLRRHGELTTQAGDVIVFDAESGDVLVIPSEANPPGPSEAALQALAECRAPVSQGNAANGSQGNVSGVTAAS